MERGLVTLIGMSIAYVASFIGLWLAWYGWKKRHGESTSGPVVTGYGALIVGVLGAVYAFVRFRPHLTEVPVPKGTPLPATPPIGGPIWTIVVPGALLVVAIWGTWLLYRHFAKEE
jgi:hypothetical protein